MSGFFSGFTGGMEAGGRIAQRGMDNYEKRQKEESEGKMFKIATELGASQKAQAEADGEREGIANAFNNASVGDMTSMIMEKHIADGGKINDHSYKMAYSMANTMYGVRNMEQKYQNDKKFFDVKMRKGEAEIARLNAIAKNGGSSRGGMGSEEKRYGFFKNTLGEDVANEDLRGSVRGTPKRKEVTNKMIDEGSLILSNRVEGFDDLSKDEQWEASKQFASTGELPKLEEYEEKGEYWGTNTKTRLKGSSSNPTKTKKSGTKQTSGKTKYTTEFYDNMIN